MVAASGNPFVAIGIVVVIDSIAVPGHINQFITIVILTIVVYAATVAVAAIATACRVHPHLTPGQNRVPAPGRPSTSATTRNRKQCNQLE